LTLRTLGIDGRHAPEPDASARDCFAGLLPRPVRPRCRYVHDGCRGRPA
jgi:hypothetical protein